MRDEADHAPRSAIEDADLSETSLGEVEDEKAHAERKRVRRSKVPMRESELFNASRS